MAMQYKSQRLLIAPSATVTLSFQTSDPFKDLSVSITSEGRTVVNASYEVLEGTTNLVSGSYTSVQAAGIVYTDDHTRGPNQPNSNWALQQQGMSIPNTPITLSITNNDTHSVVLVGEIRALTLLFV